jgi:CheY-like chemotaxis protein/HPt (histidine-containing phosphotransfer) domain-containing protein
MLLSGYPNLRLHPNTSNNQKIALPLQKGPALKILIAEDNIINQEVAFNMLSKLGHSVTVVNNGEEAVEAVLGENYDIIFMDVQMPKMNGYEATGRICEIEKNTNHKTHIIGLTANAMQGDREKCVEKGMDDYVSKPFRAPHIINAIERFTTKVKMGIGQQRNNRDEKPLVNLQALFENLNRDEEMFEEFVGKLPKHITTSFEKLERAVKLENLADIEFAAHSLRGLCLYLDMYKVSALTIEIEKSATSSNLHTMVTLVNRMKKELHRALEYLQQVREESLAEILL